MKTQALLPSAKALMESIRSVGYSLESAIADIIDNSLSAGAKKIHVDFVAFDNPYISISDDGCGMDDAELLNAMRYGSKNPNDARHEMDLGRYGLGLKTASLSQCRKLTVLSKKKGKVYGCCWDLNHIQRSKEEWSLIILEKDELLLVPGFDRICSITSGTLVVWNDLDRIFIEKNAIPDVLDSRMNVVRDHLGLVFHRFLRKEEKYKKVSMFLNNEVIQAADPFLQHSKGPKSIIAKAHETIIIDGEKITACPYILPHDTKLSNKTIKELGGRIGLRKTQGFYIYRNRRLITSGTWFGMHIQGELFKLARIQVDIPNTLDKLWTLDIKKSTAIPPDEIKHTLQNYIRSIAEHSATRYRTRGKKETQSQFTLLWSLMRDREDNIYYQVNREHPLVSVLVNKNSAWEALITLMERSIPINDIYERRVNDEKIGNTDGMTLEQVLVALKILLRDINNCDDRSRLLSSLLSTHPFCDFANEIKEQQSEILK
jgi:hypothetical protein